MADFKLRFIVLFLHIAIPPTIWKSYLHTSVLIYQCPGHQLSTISSISLIGAVQNPSTYNIISAYLHQSRGKMKLSIGQIFTFMFCFL